MAGYPRVTHPSATKFKITRFHLNFVRLACVKHAASVHPEPGSNSQLKVFSCQNIWLFPFLKLFVQAFGITVFRLFLNFSPVSSKQSFSLPFDSEILRIHGPTGFAACYEQARQASLPFVPSTACFGILIWNFQGCIIVYLSRFCTAFLSGNFDRISQPQFIVNTFLKSFLKFFVEIRTI